MPSSKRTAGNSGSPADRLTERLARHLARTTARRSLLTRLGALLVAAPVLPLLPVMRANAAGPAPKPAPRPPLTDFERNSQAKDATQCNYWRHCAMDGVVCGCCGGGIHTCPPGSQPSLTAWIGTCLNPEDGRSYLVSYRDCCGKELCTVGKECMCSSTDRELPVYRPQSNNDTIWCFGTSSMAYHCTTSALIGVASDQ